MDKHKIMNENDRLITHACKKYSYMSNYEDILQEARMFVFKKLDDYDQDKCKLSTFICKLAAWGAGQYIHISSGRTIKKDSYKVNYENINTPSSFEFKISNDDGDESELGNVIKYKEDFTELESDNFLDILNERDKAIFKMHADGFVQHEISEAVGINRANVSRSIKRSKEKLKNNM